MCSLLVIDENGNRVESKDCEIKNYSLSVNEQNKLTLKITRSDDKILSYSVASVTLPVVYSKSEVTHMLFVTKF